VLPHQLPQVAAGGGCLESASFHEATCTWQAYHLDMTVAATRPSFHHPHAACCSMRPLATPPTVHDSRRRCRTNALQLACSANAACLRFATCRCGSRECTHCPTSLDCSYPWLTPCWDTCSGVLSPPLLGGPTTRPIQWSINNRDMTFVYTGYSAKMRPPEFNTTWKCCYTFGQTSRKSLGPPPPRGCTPFLWGPPTGALAGAGPHSHGAAAQEIPRHMQPAGQPQQRSPQL
jgi:hypothetical protein